MRNALHDHFVAHNGQHGSLEKTAIEAFSRFMPDPNWLPPHPYLMDFGPIIQIGVLAAILEGKIGASSLLKGVISAITDGKQPDATVLSELHTGALLERLGGRPAFLKADTQHGVRSPDILSDFSGQRIDVEVVRADERLAHELHRKTQETLATVIHGQPGTRYDVHIAVELTNAVLERIVDAASTTPIGSVTDVPEQWCLAVRIAEDGGGTTPDFVPDWWKGAGPSFFVVMQTIGGAAPPPRVTVKTTVPLIAYINPVRRKAERPQRSGDFPYIVALDASELFGAPDRLEVELQDWFGLWLDVSAVLVQFPWFPFSGERGWRCRLLRNPGARLPVDPEWIDPITETTLVRCAL
jgi:hypothetical protein